MPVVTQRIGWEIASLIGSLMLFLGGIIAYSTWQLNVALRERRERELKRLRELVGQADD